MGQSRTHFLLVGDSGDIPAIEATLRRLPVNAYGQVFLEAASPLQFHLIHAPESVTVTWLFRDASRGILEPAPPRGERAVRAVQAWLAEWMPERRAQREPLVLWIGCSDNDLVDELYAQLRANMPHLHLHHPQHDPANGQVDQKRR